MRGATGVTIQPHQILRLSRRKTHILSPHHIWNVIYSARSNRCHDPTSPNTAPATKNDSTALSSSHMKRHLQCAEQQVSRSNLTKYCACHAERLAYLVLITYETSFTLRAATGVTIQPHQILRLSRRKTHILSPHRIWNVIYSARSNRCHHPTSPNTAPATKNDSTALSSSHPPPLRGPLPPKPASHFLRWGSPSQKIKTPPGTPSSANFRQTINNHSKQNEKKTLAKLQHLAHTALQSWQHTTSHDPVFPAPIPPVVAGSDNALFPRDCWRVCVLFPCISSRFPRRL